MKKEIADSLRHMQNNPTTGAAHNAQLISAQVETIFMLDDLKTEVVNLNKTIKSSNEQSVKLELSNNRFQLMILILTAITTMIAIYPFLRIPVTLIASGLALVASNVLKVSILQSDFVAALSGFISLMIGIVTFYLERKFVSEYKIKLNDTIHVTDSAHIARIDKDGNIKDNRSSN
jgi:hypothetical protein